MEENRFSRRLSIVSSGGRRRNTLPPGYSLKLGSSGSNPVKSGAPLSPRLCETFKDTALALDSSFGQPDKKNVFLDSPLFTLHLSLSLSCSTKDTTKEFSLKNSTFSLYISHPDERFSTPWSKKLQIYFSRLRQSNLSS